MAQEIFDNNQVYQISKDEYARVVETLGTDTYIAFAIAGTPTVSALWQVQKIDTNGTRTWADGDTAFDNVATSPLSGLTFS